MSSLAKLTIKAVTRQNQLSPAEARRNKLLAGINEQMDVADAAMRGEQYAVTAPRWTKNEAGEKVRVQRQRVVRSWFFERDGGVYIQCKYGSKALPLGVVCDQDRSDWSEGFFAANRHVVRHVNQHCRRIECTPAFGNETTNQDPGAPGHAGLNQVMNLSSQPFTRHRPHFCDRVFGIPNLDLRCLGDKSMSELVCNGTFNNNALGCDAHLSAVLEACGYGR